MSDVAKRTSRDSESPTDAGQPSAFFREHEARLSKSGRIGPTLDLACGRGRHTLAAARLGLDVVAIDRDLDCLRGLIDSRRQAGAGGNGGVGQIRPLCTDLESPPIPPLAAASFGAVLVFRYLHRPLFPWIESLVAPGGFVLYESFTEEQRSLGWGPRRDAFLLRAGELRELLPGLVVEVYEEGSSNDERPAYTARLLASRAPLAPR